MVLHNKVALITGGSAGIGLAAAKKLVALGVKVALVARKQAMLDAAVAQLGAQNAVAFALDVNDRAAMTALPGQVVTRLGQLDILINNAGYNCRGAVQERTPQELLQILETNLLAPVFLTRVALDHLRPGGIIINVASLAGKIPVGHEACYSASKFGLRAFSRALASDLGERGIRVSCINPGPVDTEFFGDIATVPDLVFSQPMSSADQVADAILECIQSVAPPLEVDVPNLSGSLAQLGYLLPSVAAALQPMLARKGAKQKAAYIRKKAGR